MASDFIGKFISLDRRKKILLVLSLDSLLIVLGAYFSLVLRVSDFWSEFHIPLLPNLIIYWLICGVLLSWIMELPFISVRAFDSTNIQKISLYCAALSLSGFLVNLLFEHPSPRSLPIIFGVVLLVMMVGSRLLLTDFFNRVESAKNPRKRTLIYGAGEAGIQLANALKSSNTTEVFAFVDDNPKMENLTIGRLKVHSSKNMGKLLRRHEIRQIVLAMPSVSISRRKEILNDLQPLNRELLTLPHFGDFLSGKSLADQIRPVTAADLLGRESRKIDRPEISEAYSGKRVLITGAGGSIGSELCHQISEASPELLVVLDTSEYALYSIERQLKLKNPDKPVKLVSILGSVTNDRLVRNILTENRIEIVLHAAAYKHVPLIESNEVAGAFNNALGTRILANACSDLNVASFILISTDKAVRPTNVMGATKRFAEMVIQDLQTRATKTVFSMVRFGNVLDSSGSVIPLFREQIAKGGPVTVTHAEVTRFFMTIREAAQLVLLAGTYAEGGDVFVLDMGKPVKVLDLAHNLIHLSGLTAITPETPNGNIEIEFTGLRPGEKLYEELLIGNNLVGTPHPKIMRAREDHLTQFETAAALKRLKKAVETGDQQDIRLLFTEMIDGFQNQALDVKSAEDNLT